MCKLKLQIKFFLLGLIALSVVCEEGLDKYVVHRFSPPNAVMNHLAVDEKLKYVYIAAENRLYQLNKNLSTIVAIDATGPVLDNVQCIPLKHCGETKKLTNNTNKLLLVDSNGKRLITCGNIYQGACETRDLNNVSKVLFKITPETELLRAYMIACNTKDGSTVGIIAQGPTVNNSVLYIAASETEGVFGVPATISTHSLHFDPEHENDLFKYAISLPQGNEGSKLEEDSKRDYKYIFESGGADGFIYYVFSRDQVLSTGTTETTHGKRSVVARICKSDILYYSYVELPVDCVQDGLTYDITGAYYAKSEKEGEMLYILFTSVSTNKQRKRTAVCSFSKKRLDDLFYNTVEVCYKQNGNNGTLLVQTIESTGVDCKRTKTNDPWLGGKDSSLLDPIVQPTNVFLEYYPNYKTPKTQVLCGAQYLPAHLTRTVFTTGNVLFQKDDAEFSAITINRVHGRTVGFIGTKQGAIFQVNFNTREEFNKIEVGHKILPDFIWDQDPKLDVPHLYVTTSSEVLHIRVAACETYTTCEACQSSSNPYCGWCILESRCSTKKECKTTSREANDRWLSTETPQCIYAKPPVPKDRTLSIPVTVTVNLLPVLGEKLYKCVFDGQYAFEATIQATEGPLTNLLCNTPSHDQLPQSFSHEDYVNVTLSVRYDDVDIVSTVAVFYECGVYGLQLETHRPCAGCLTSRWQCMWCVTCHRCKPRESAKESFIGDLNACPTILSVSPQDKIIPVGKPHAITLTAKNLPSDDMYKCRIDFGRNSNSITVDAKTLSSGATVRCKEHNYTYSKDLSEAKADVTVMWKTSYVVDNGREDSSTITFYKCGARRNDCSRCVTANPKFQCGWCQTTEQCSIRESCSSLKWVTDGDQCPEHQISKIVPQSGPTAGGTPVKIIGMDMGTKASDVQRVTIGKTNCALDQSLYKISNEVVCITGPVQSQGPAEVAVTVKNVTKVFSGSFQFRNPILYDVTPKLGPMVGGTVISITGLNLDTGTRPKVWISDNPRINCIVNSPPNSTMLICITSGSSRILSNQSIHVKFDGAVTVLPGKYSYTENPLITDYYTLTAGQLSSFLSGGRNISVKGKNFLSVQAPYLIATMQHGVRRRRRTASQAARRLFGRVKRSRSSRSTAAESNGYDLPAYVYDRGYGSSCKVENGTFMVCHSPQINITSSRTVVSTNISDSVFWPAQLVMHMDNMRIELGRELQYYPDPKFVKFGKTKDKREDELLSIKVYNLKKEAITKGEIFITVGKKRCVVESIDGDKVLCTIPQNQGEKGEEYDVEVRIGHGNDPISLGTMAYYSDPPPITEEVTTAIIVSGVVLFIVIIAIVVYFVRKNKSYKADKNDFQKAMENLEMSVRADFRKAFAELNVDMSDLTADIGDQGIPCLDYRTYVTNLFFPSFKYHPCTNAPDPDAQFPSNLEQGLSQFLRLLSNRSFLTVFIHTLEEQKGFSNRDKGNVASLLTVALHDKLDYFTEIMKSLVLDLISVNVQRNPKLILRRSDSVAERMLSNWMYICLYPYLRDKAGSPIFLLLKAIKQQVSKGPLDAITGKSRYTLSDDRLLQEDVENEVLTLFIAPNSKSDDDEGEPVIVKVLSCDSVAQVKEKVMDAVYKRVPFSMRPKPEQLDIEWRHGRSGHLVLPNQDYSSEPGGRWRRLMTIVDYKVANNATLALIPRQQELEGSQDLSMSNRSVDTSPLSPMLPEDGTTKTYHLLKYNDDIEAKRESTINRDRHKHIADLYLLRLINMKGILQNYVDAVFQTILDKSSIPCPVKHFFHFLDDIAAKQGITNSEILHIWKTNSLLGRFWVTILKSPESVFDVEKPDSISSSMAVISQTFIDACSVNEHKPTKDSPINKQLYAKEIPNYKKMVQEYYNVVKEQPPISDQDVNAYIAGLSREHGCKFDVPVALKELWGYLNKYYEEVNESLENDVNISPAVIQKLKQTYDSIDTAANNGG